MKKKTQNRTLKISVALSPQEYQKIEKRWKASTCRTLTEYNRSMLFAEPIIMTHRNRSLDELMEEVIELKTELNSLSNHFKQLLNKTDPCHQCPEFNQWVLSYALDKEALFKKIDEIKNTFQKITASWLQ